MNYIIIFHKPDFYELMLKIAGKISNQTSIRKYGEELESELYISSVLDRDQYVYIHSPRVLVVEECYDPCDVEEVLKLVKEPNKLMASNIEYKEYDILHEALQIISENAKECYIDNDFGTILSVCDFVKKWSDNPDWNWIYDLDDKDSDSRGVLRKSCKD
ncbi:MAG: hypothetical protein WBB28_20160, partial [Crinalium sp.]